MICPESIAYRTSVEVALDVIGKSQFFSLAATSRFKWPDVQVLESYY